MGFWDIINATTPVLPRTSLLAAPRVTPYAVYKQYFSPYTTGGKAYDLPTFRDDVREARNHGLALDSAQVHAMRMLAKHGDEWFDAQGNLREGLSRRQARRALKFKTRTLSYYNKIKARVRKKSTPKQNPDLWAANNFIKNGYDRASASKYAGITDYNGLADLWGGDTAGVKAGGIYGDKAAVAEQAYYDSLSGPAKRAYLRQREEWKKAGIISGDKLANLVAPTDNDMRTFITQNLDSWYNDFYGSDGYLNEYMEAHPTLDPEKKAQYEKYGLPISVAEAATWAPANDPLRTSGFTLSKVEKAKKAVEKKGAEKKDETVKKDANKKNTSKIIDLTEFEAL